MFRYLVYHSGKLVLKYKPEYWEDNVELQPVSVGDAVYYYSKGKQEHTFHFFIYDTDYQVVDVIWL